MSQQPGVERSFCKLSHPGRATSQTWLSKAASHLFFCQRFWFSLIFSRNEASVVRFPADSLQPDVARWHLVVPAVAAEEEISRLLQISGPRCDPQPHIGGSGETVRAELRSQYPRTSFKKKKIGFRRLFKCRVFIFMLLSVFFVSVYLCKKTVNKKNSCFVLSSLVLSKGHWNSSSLLFVIFHKSTSEPRY